MEINSNHSTYGAAFRQKPIFFMSGKETVAFFEGKLKKNMTLQEDSCTLGSNDTYRRQHTTYEVSDKITGSFPCNPVFQGIPESENRPVYHNRCNIFSSASSFL